MFYADRCVWPYAYRRGGSPLIVSMPHVGTFVPHALGSDLADRAARRPDTDWHLARLYDFLADLDATVIRAQYSRYAIDVNRPPDGSNLYPGQDTPRLCPVDTFHGEPLYRAGRGPDIASIRARLDAIWLPYHVRLQREIERVRGMHGVAVLWDAHSIASEVPRLFPGRLPDFNLGTAGGLSCAPDLASALHVALSRHAAFTAVRDGRFKGGYITRAYGRPADGVHAIQLEMATSTYMDEASPYTFRTDLASRVRPVLREQLEIVLGWSTGQLPVRLPGQGLQQSMGEVP